ncbi:MAG: extensin family protein [Rhodobacteraceae bacterium]|nr:extensin family protein [Paracoccaceae bacterium]
MRPIITKCLIRSLCFALVLSMMTVEAFFPVVAAAAQKHATLDAPMPFAHPLRRSEQPVGPRSKPDDIMRDVEQTLEEDVVIPGDPTQCISDIAVIEGLPDPLVGENGCGVDQPVVLKGLAQNPEMSIRPNPTLRCDFAKSVAMWLQEDVQPIARKIFDEELSEVVGGPGYQCRRRNNSKTGKLSEHARGKAMDISAFRFASGRRVSVEGDWAVEGVGDARPSQFLRAVHKSACERFSTVLGPEADVHHRSHFHIDIGCHGKTCTYLICQ